MPRKNTQCSDWHLGWGYGGQNALGKLYYINDKEFEWKGTRQGRHGQKYGKYEGKVFLDDEGKISSVEGSLPTHSEIYKAIEILLNEKQKQ